MKQYIMAIIAATTLVACDPVVGNDPSSKANMANVMEAGKVSSAVAINYFSKYCYPNLGNNRMIKSKIKADGYKELNGQRVGNVSINVFTNKSGDPIIGLAKKTKSPDICMVFMGEDGKTVSLIEKFVKRASNDDFIKMPAIPRSKGVWMFSNDQETLTLIMISQPRIIEGVGKMQAIAGMRGKDF